MQPQRRLFSHDEATALIPILRPILKSIQHEKRKLDELHGQLGAMSDAMKTNGHASKAAELELEITGLIETLRTAVAEIHDLGVEVKDLDSGLVDFPSERAGRIVYLCWMVDEPGISYWHDLDTGFAGREPL